MILREESSIATGISPFSILLPFLSNVVNGTSLPSISVLSLSFVPVWIPTQLKPIRPEPFAFSLTVTSNVKSNTSLFTGLPSFISSSTENPPAVYTSSSSTINIRFFLRTLFGSCSKLSFTYVYTFVSKSNPPTTCITFPFGLSQHSTWTLSPGFMFVTSVLVIIDGTSFAACTSICGTATNPVMTMTRAKTKAAILFSFFFIPFSPLLYFDDVTSIPSKST